MVLLVVCLNFCKYWGYCYPATETFPASVQLVLNQTWIPLHWPAILKSGWQGCVVLSVKQFLANIHLALATLKVC